MPQRTAPMRHVPATETAHKVSAKSAPVDRAITTSNDQRISVAHSPFKSLESSPRAFSLWSKQLPCWSSTATNSSSKNSARTRQPNRLSVRRQMRRRPHTPALSSSPARAQEKPRDKQLTQLTKYELDSRWKAFRNACRRPKHRRVVERVVLHLRHKHDKMD